MQHDFDKIKINSRFEHWAKKNQYIVEIIYVSNLVKGEELIRCFKLINTVTPTVLESKMMWCSKFFVFFSLLEKFHQSPSSRGFHSTNTAFTFNVLLNREPYISSNHATT